MLSVSSVRGQVPWGQASPGPWEKVSFPSRGREVFGVMAADTKGSPFRGPCTPYLGTVAHRTRPGETFPRAAK